MSEEPVVHALRAGWLTVTGVAIAGVGFPGVAAFVEGAAAVEGGYAFRGFMAEREATKKWREKIDQTRQLAGQEVAR